MKDFCKWLGVNEKIAKIVVWLFIFMLMLIIINTALESLGLSYYKLTTENLSGINYNQALDYVFSWILCLLNFYSMIFIVFRLKEFKNIFKYSIVYLIINILITIFTDQIVANIFIPLFVLIFSFFYSNKNWKYVIYTMGSIFLNTFVQYQCYLYKARFLNFSQMNYLNKILTSIDYLIIIFVIILIKEIIIKNKKEG